MTEEQALTKLYKNYYLPHAPGRLGFNTYKIMEGDIEKLKEYGIKNIRVRLTSIRTKAGTRTGYIVRIFKK